MAEWLEHWTCNPEAPSSSPTLIAIWIYSSAEPNAYIIIKNFASTFTEMRIFLL